VGNLGVADVGSVEEANQIEEGKLLLVSVGGLAQSEPNAAILTHGISFMSSFRSSFFSCSTV